MKVFKGQIADSEAERLVAEAGDLMPGDVIAVELAQLTPQQETDARIVEGYQVLLSDDLRLAHAAILEYANAHNDDFWPKGRDVIRFARFYRVSASALGGLVGLLPYRLGRRMVWVDAARVPEVARRVGIATFSREAQVSFGIFCAAAATLDRESATLH